MRIEGQLNHFLANQRRVDAQHTKHADKLPGTQKSKTAVSAHQSELRAELADKLRAIPEVRSEEVQRVAAKLRGGEYTTGAAAEKTAAAILAARDVSI